MFKDVTFGQYYPGNSLLHRADARIKIIVLLIYLVIALAARSALAVMLAAAFTLVLIIISRIRIPLLLKTVKPLVFILVFTAVINVFFTSGEGEPLVKAGFITIYFEGIRNAVIMFVRLISIVLGSSVLLSFTTTPIELTDAIESLLSPLKLIKVPVHEFAMMMSIALKFIPILIEETNKIISAQKARCADFETGNVIRRIKSLVPVLIPLFVSAIRRAEELADAMECRCYRGGEGRTKLKEQKTRPADWIMLFCAAAVCAGVIFLNRVWITEVWQFCRGMFS